MNKVVVTGIGLVTPLGFGREQSWEALINSKSGIKSDLENKGLLLARLENFDVPDETRLLSMAFLAGAEAVNDTNLDFMYLDPQRIGCTISVSKPNLAQFNPQSASHPDIFSASTLGKQLYQVFKLRGPLQNIKAACSTGTNSIIIGAEWIKHGVCDIVFCGSAESSIHPLYQAGFKQMGVLASKQVCPFDKKREGFAIGEGAGIIILERKDYAILRGAKIYGEIAGYAMANDISGAVSFSSGGEVIAGAIRNALKQAGLESVDYLNAHGTATKLNDLVETRAIKKALGKKACLVSISSTKAATGHLLGASGAVEFAFSLLALRDRIAPPTLNLTEPDNECDLDYTPQVPKSKQIDTVMSLSFGFGGQIGVLVATR